MLIVEVYRMWDFQYSRIRMRILHFDIRGYRMRILYIIILGLWKWVSATDDEENSENYAVIKLMNEYAINEWNINIWCIKQWNYIKMKNLLKRNYLFHRNLQFQKFIKTSPSV